MSELAIIHINPGTYHGIFPWEKERDMNRQPTYLPGNAQVIQETEHVKQGTDGEKNIKVTGPASLRFRITMSGVYPIGIGFKRAHGNPNGESGSTLESFKAVPRESLKFGKDEGAPDVNYWVQFDDTHVDSFHWKYFIITQDNWGNLAVIDPEIENDPV